LAIVVAGGASRLVGQPRP